METQVTPQTPARAGRDKSWQSGCLVWVMALMLMGFGVVIGIGGWKAVSTRHHEMTWKSRGTFSGSENGVNVYDGADAVRVGTGLMLGGLMLFIWGLVLARTGGGGGDGKNVRLTAVGRATTWTSLLCMLAGAGCLMPPWHLRNLIFYGILVLPAMVLPALEEEFRKRWAGRLFVVLILTAIVCGRVVMLRIALGIFAALFAAAHVMLLFPDLMKTDRR